MEYKQFMERALKYIATNERVYFIKISNSVLKNNYKTFIHLVKEGNTALASFRACDHVRVLCDKFKTDSETVLAMLPIYLELFLTLRINNIELGPIRALPEEYSMENIKKEVQEMMNEIR